MTFSIAARSPDASQWGVAVASKFLAVGAAVPAAAAGVGAIATQAWANLGYRPDGLRLLRDGLTPDAVVAGLTAADDGAAKRQVGVVGATGDGASYTGTECTPWAGGRTGDGYAIQGNILTGPDVVAAMESTYAAADGPFARQLLAALAAGDAAGGDKRGRQSAALYVVSEGGGYGGGSDVLVDLRVDDHDNPVPELVRLLDLHDIYFGKPDPAQVRPLAGDLLAEVAGYLRTVGYLGSGVGDSAAVGIALADWAGVENVEERLVDGQIDPVVLEMLRGKAGGTASL
ncbi:MAG: DUF1028 domain-containing protein [Mycobacteriales bacterium]|nr:DUF1028 domain-containing protein [Frankia sp.]